jgi:hypothetical protein
MTDYRKMSDEELSAEVATKVMGWEQHGEYWHTLGDGIAKARASRDYSRGRWCGEWDIWSPATRWDHAGEVLARLRSMEHVDSVSLIIDDEHAGCGITTRGRLVPDWRGTAPADQPGPGRALCLAALAAVGARDGL